MKKRLFQRSIYFFKCQTRYIFRQEGPEVKPTYGGRYVVTLLTGLACGPRLGKFIKEAFFEMGIPIDFQELSIDKTNDEYRELKHVVTTMRRNALALGGPVGFHTDLNFDVEIRKRLKMYYYLTHIKSYPGIPAKVQDIDIVIIRQNIGGEFTMMEHESVKGVITYLKVMERKNVEKVVKFAYDYAEFSGRKKVTTIHKANIIKLSDGLFLNVSREIGKKYTNLKYNDLIVDNACMQLVQNPKQYDVIVTTNLYGMLAANILIGLSGGPGLYAGINIGKQCVFFEPAARSHSKDIVGKNIINPVAMFNASLGLLDYLGFKDQSNLLKDAIEDTICTKQIRTPDIGGKNRTSEIVEAIMNYIIDYKHKMRSF